MPSLTLPLTGEQFQKLPRHPAYHYEYLEGKAFLTPRSRHFHGLLTLRPVNANAAIGVRPVVVEDFEELLPIFAAAFQRIQPYGGLDHETRLLAVREALERTRSGGDGPWIPQASFVALHGGKPSGAIFITLLPASDPREWDSFHWTEKPPADAVQRRLGRPHLTWIFVSPLLAGQGVGTALLAAASRELLALGFAEMASTFMIGNDSSMLWHWRNGFELVSYPTSRRRRWDG